MMSVGHVLGYVLDHVPDHVPDHVIIGLVATALQNIVLQKMKQKQLEEQQQ